MRRRAFFFMIIVALALPLWVLAQSQPPSQIDRVLQDLSQRVGVTPTLTVTDLDYWSWSEEVFPDTSLGCPQPDTAYTQVRTRAYRFTLTYNGTAYEYRISADQTILILCGTTILARECPPPLAGVDYTPTRLREGSQARVVLGFTVVLRTEPASGAAPLTEIPENTVVDLLEGPICAYGSLQYWNVSYVSVEGIVYSGWATEGYDGEYYFEPLEGEEIGQPRQRIVAASADSLSPAVTFPAQTSAYSPDGRWLALQQQDAIQMVNLDDGSGEPIQIQGNQQMILAFSSDSALIAVGALDTVRTYQVTTGEERGVFSAPNAILTAVTFSSLRAGETSASPTLLVAAGDSVGRLWFWDTVTVTRCAQLPPVPGMENQPIVELRFSADGTRLYVRDVRGFSAVLEVGEGYTDILPTFTPTPDVTATPTPSA